MTLELQTDRSLVRAAGRSIRYLHVSFAAPDAPTRPERQPLSVAFVLDRSGSMHGDKIRLAREAIDVAIRMLTPLDTFSVVAYDDRVDIVTAATPATAPARSESSARLSFVDPRGSTDLCQGGLAGGGQVAEMAWGERLGRCFVRSDGLTGLLQGKDTLLASRAAELRAAHVSTSTFGVGADFDERLLAAMARAGGGSHFFIQHPQQIQDLLTRALGETLEVVARGAAVTLDLPANVDAEVMHDLRTERLGQSLRIELDDLVSAQDVSFIVRLGFPAADVGYRTSVSASVSSRDGHLDASSRIAWTFADHAANDAQPRNVRVDRLVAAMYAARARRDAVELNRAGNFTAAQRVIGRTKQRIQAYAGGDSELNGIAGSLAKEQAAHETRLGAIQLKESHQASVSALRMRTAQGFSPRRTPPQSQKSKSEVENDEA